MLNDLSPAAQRALALPTRLITAPLAHPALSANYDPMTRMTLVVDCGLDALKHGVRWCACVSTVDGTKDSEAVEAMAIELLQGCGDPFGVIETHTNGLTSYASTLLTLDELDALPERFKVPADPTQIGMLDALAEAEWWVASIEDKDLRDRLAAIAMHEWMHGPAATMGMLH